MGSPLAPMLVVWLASAAALDVDVGLRADALSTTTDRARSAAEGQSALSGVPSVAGILDAADLRLTATYAPRLWTPDLEARAGVQVSHALEARLATLRPDRTWRLATTASALRGKTDVLLDASRSAALTGATQVPTTRTLAREELQAGLLGEVALDPRTTLGGGGGWRRSRVLGADAGLLPPQRGVSLDASAARLLTELDTLRLSANVARTVTDRAGGQTTRSDTGAVVVTWRRRLALDLEGWVGGGPSVTYSEELASGGRYEVLPAAELGVVRRPEGRATRFEAAVRATTFVDRYTGAASPSIEARLGAGWPFTERLTFSASAAASSRTDGATSIGRADARLAWAVRPTLGFEAGVLARAQQERRADRTSFEELAAFASVVYRRDRIFGTTDAYLAPPTAPMGGARGEPTPAPESGNVR